jgi:hypothetical protein
MRSKLSRPIRGGKKATPIGPNAYAAVDDRDEMRRRNEIEDMPWPGPIDATEEQIAIESATETFFIVDTEGNSLKIERISRCVRWQNVGEHIYL